MGLAISSPDSKATYSRSYSALQHMRYGVYKMHGGQKEFPRYMDTYDDHTLFCFTRFPNFMYHSDCEGGYKANGPKNPTYSQGLLWGNSKELLKEMNTLVRMGIYKNLDDIDGKSFRSFHKIVRDSVTTGSGLINFH